MKRHGNLNTLYILLYYLVYKIHKRIHRNINRKNKSAFGNMYPKALFIVQGGPGRRPERFGLGSHFASGKPETGRGDQDFPLAATRASRFSRRWTISTAPASMPVASMASRSATDWKTVSSTTRVLPSKSSSR